MQIHLDIEPVQLGYPVDIGDGDVVHLEPAVHARVVQAKLLRDVFPLNTVLAHCHAQESQAGQPVRIHQALDIHEGGR